MKALFYKMIVSLLKNYNRFYFKRLRVYGLENIPKKGGLLFSPNHQNAFLDPVLVGTTCKSEVTSLTRGDVFVKPFNWFLSALKMLPVYRIRNGYSNLKKNNPIFEHCQEILGKEENVMMFSEGRHHNEYFLQRLSKGSSRLALQAQAKFPESLIYIIPVGINYSHHQRPWQEVHVVYGAPILVSDFLESYMTNESITINQLREKLEAEMQACLWIPRKEERYFEQKKYINYKNTKLGFSELKEQLNTDPQKLKVSKDGGALIHLIVGILSIPNIIPLLVVRKVVSLFPDVVFHNSMKYIVGLFMFAFWWKIILFTGCYFFGMSTAIGLISISILSLYLRQLLVTVYFSKQS